MPPPFAGIWPAMLTPTTPDGQPNLPACERLVDLFARQNLGGIYLVGSTGGWPLFSVAERKQIAQDLIHFGNFTLDRKKRSFALLIAIFRDLHRDSCSQSVPWP